MRLLKKDQKSKYGYKGLLNTYGEFETHNALCMLP